MIPEMESEHARDCETTRVFFYPHLFAQLKKKQ